MRFLLPACKDINVPSVQLSLNIRGESLAFLLTGGCTFRVAEFCIALEGEAV